MSQKKNGLSNLVLITQLGINVLTPIFLCLLAGGFIDRKFGTKTILIFLILGVLSGALSAYRTAKNTIDRERRENEREQAERERGWNERFGGKEDDHE